MKKKFKLFLLVIIPNLLNAQTNKPLSEPEENLTYSINAGSSIYAIASSPDGMTLAYSKKSSIVLVEFETGKPIKEFDVSKLAKSLTTKNKITASIGYVRTIDFHPDGKKMAVGFIGGVVLIDIKSESILWYCQGTNDRSGYDSANSVYTVRCSNSYVFASSYFDNTIYSWNIADGSLNTKFATPFKEIYSIDVTSTELNGKMVVSGNGGLILYKFNGEKIWQMDRFTNSGPVDINRKDSVIAVACVGFGSRIILLDMYDTKKKYDLGPAADRPLGGVCWSKTKKSVYCCAKGMGTAPVLQYSLVKNEIVKTVISKDFDTDPDCDRGCVIGGAGFLLAVAGKNKMINVYAIEK